MVGAAMAEGELVRRVAGREAEQLVTEADPEDGDAAEKLAHDLGLGDERLGVAGAIREDDAVERRPARPQRSCAGRPSPLRRLSRVGA